MAAAPSYAEIRAIAVGAEAARPRLAVGLRPPALPVRRRDDRDPRVLDRAGRDRRGDLIGSQLGTIVMCTSFRNPALLAKMAATLDHISGGRLILGIGCGWHDPEYEAFGYPTDHKVGRFEEALTVIRGLIREGRADLAGRWVTGRPTRCWCHRPAPTCRSSSPPSDRGCSSSRRAMPMPGTWPGSASRMSAGRRRARALARRVRAGRPRPRDARTDRRRQRPVSGPHAPPLADGSHADRSGGPGADPVRCDEVAAGLRRLRRRGDGPPHRGARTDDAGGRGALRAGRARSRQIAEAAAPRPRLPDVRPDAVVGFVRQHEDVLAAEQRARLPAQLRSTSGAGRTGGRAPRRVSDSPGAGLRPHTRNRTDRAGRGRSPRSPGSGPVLVGSAVAVNPLITQA